MEDLGFDQLDSVQISLICLSHLSSAMKLKLRECGENEGVTKYSHGSEPR
jgi:hypothetical protein